MVNARFTAMCAHYLFDTDFCIVASGWEKGGGEECAGQPPAHLARCPEDPVGSFADLNVWLGERCHALWGELRHPEFKGFSVLEMLEQELVADQCHGIAASVLANVNRDAKHHPEP